MGVKNSTIKRERQNVERRARNRAIKSKVHTAFLNLSKAIGNKDREDVEARLRIYMSEVDKAVKRNALHKNNGARKKSRIVKRIKTVFNENA
ncbi:MAG TPA: 30S ribosomal protein S20 [Spirochaetota bacterium]|jgi:small subunit ribosomal protein S20|nr:MAG: 30S ribosomal protein S20 [Spirochaetes bacterium ADurb.Bin133]HNZ27406.1 30S ribosomal protein S20 [Spirochaetota bacterium]HOF00180.1 30S ribosomal protein S20 [Spirochaetota bacterium]HOS32945.1 30S ribosomal protein S20 [Spirochaetota bacterium]HOS54889.1 30S ribosomal protein S20 [Spirochaetota bacterium]